MNASMPPPPSVEPLSATAVAEGARLNRTMEDWTIAATLRAEETVRAGAPGAMAAKWSQVDTAAEDLRAAAAEVDAASDAGGAPDTAATSC